VNKQFSSIMLKKEPLVTIYIPSRNYARYLRKCIKSVCDQTYNNWELILIDEGSTDETFNIINEYALNDTIRIKILKHETPIGLQRIANKVLSIAKGSYLLRLDADDWLHEFALEILVTKLETNPGKSIAFGNFHFVDDKGRIIGTESRYNLGQHDQLGLVPPHGACTLVQTRALKKVGGYSESVDAQDGWDLWLRQGGKDSSVSTDLVIFFYRQHNSSLSKNSERLLNSRRQIFSEAAKRLNGGYKLRNVAVIPVKETYDNFKGVPYRLYKGETLLERSIKCAQSVSSIDKVIVSSADDDVFEYVSRLENEQRIQPVVKLFRKQSESKISEHMVIKIMKEAGERCMELFDFLPDTISFLSIHALGRQPKHIEEAIDILKVSGSDAVFSVQVETDPMFAVDRKGLRLINPGRLKRLEFLQENLYRFNGAVISCWWDLIQDERLLESKIAYMEMTEIDSIQLKNVAHFDPNSYDGS
jgi:glycosyltransferase involved in cell wall biosynthesis